MPPNIFVLITYLLSLVSTLAYAQSNNDNFKWGVNGHPFTQGDYAKSTWNEQITFLNDLKVNTYRVDVLLDAQGNPKNENAFHDLYNQLKSHSIEMFPALIITGLSGLDKVQIYDHCFNQGKNFALKNGDKFPCIEVGNEEDNKIISSGNGMKSSDYDEQKTPNVMAKLKGFVDGLKSVNPHTKVSLSFGWIHFYYLELLQQYQVKYDIIGYHWYSNMAGGDITNAQSPFITGNLLKLINNRFNKEIWITEFNYYRGSKNNDFTGQADFVSRSLKSILSQNIIKGFFIYELFDQSLTRFRSQNESYYGLLMKQDTGYGYKKKEIYERYKSLISNYKK